MHDKIIESKYLVFKNYDNCYIGKLTSDRLYKLIEKIVDENMKYILDNEYLWRVQ